MADLNPARHPRATLAAILLAMDEDRIADFAELLIATLDARAGDPDIELNGNERDGNSSEDDHDQNDRRGDTSPGCPIADPDLAIDDHDGGGDRSYAEWHTLSAGSRRQGRIDGRPIDLLASPFVSSLDEDAEDDDPAEDSDPREDDDSDFGAEERGEAATWPEWAAQPSCMLGGLALNEHGDDGEPRHVPVTLNRGAAND